MHWIDPESLPAIKGRVERFLINPHGDPDGLILSDGTEVHVPPHLGKDIVAALEKHSHAEVEIRGVRPREGDVFAAVSLQLPGSVRLEDRGPPDKHGTKPPKPHHKGEREERDIAGKVRRALHGPKGERRGVLLESGESGRFPPHAVAAVAPFLKAGAAFAARGKSLRTRLGEVVEADAIGEDLRSLHAIDEPHKPHKPKKPKPHHEPRHP